MFVANLELCSTVLHSPAAPPPTTRHLSPRTQEDDSRREGLIKECGVWREKWPSTPPRTWRYVLRWLRGRVRFFLFIEEMRKNPGNNDKRHNWSPGSVRKCGWEASSSAMTLWWRIRAERDDGFFSMGSAESAAALMKGALRYWMDAPECTLHEVHASKYWNLIPLCEVLCWKKFNNHFVGRVMAKKGFWNLQLELGTSRMASLVISTQVLEAKISEAWISP